MLGGTPGREGAREQGRRREREGGAATAVAHKNCFAKEEEVEKTAF
jgi:hypothetical protein